MSDLANFVAATIESKVFADLKEENDHLREKLAELKDAAQLALRLARHEGGIITITGPVGVDGPITYAEGNLRRAQYTGDITNNRGPSYAVWNFRNPVKKFFLPLVKVADFPVKQLMKADVRLNGVKVASMRHDTYTVDNDLTTGCFWEFHELFKNEPNGTVGGCNLLLDFYVYPTGNHEGGINDDELGDSWERYGDGWEEVEDDEVRDIEFQVYFECEVVEGDFFHRLAANENNDQV